MNIEQATQLLASHMGIFSWEPDEDGLYQIEYDTRLALSVFSPPDSGALYFASSLIDIDDQAPIEFFRRLLQMNFLLLQTRGASLSIDDEGRQVHLCLSLPFDLLDERKLPDLMSGFIETSLEVQARLLDERAGARALGDEVDPFVLHQQRV